MTRRGSMKNRFCITRRNFMESLEGRGENKNNRIVVNNIAAVLA